MFEVLLLFIAGAIANEECPGISKINFDAKWGPTDICDTGVTPFEIKFDPEMVADLRCRLRNRRPLTASLRDVEDFQWGVHPDEINQWLDYWANDYNFTERETFLNQVPHFVTYVQNLRIHFIHINPEVPEGKIKLPLLLLHGWPGSVREFYSTLPLLTSPSNHSNIVFEVIAPSLPGFGFSDPAVFPGMGAVEIAVLMDKLMCQLGHEYYYTQGGDWGALIGAYLATIRPNSVLGLHTNMAVALTEQAYIAITLGSMLPQAIMNEDVVSRLYPLSTTYKSLVLESGYFHVHAAKPDSISVSLTDSPAGLFSWIAQQFSFASNSSFRYLPDGGLNIYTKEQVLDNMMIYWMTRSIGTSVRIYAETTNKRNWNEGIFACPTPVPTAVTQAINEIFYMPVPALNTKFTNLVNVEVLFEGGHFLALELPEVFATEVHKGMQTIVDYRIYNNMTITQ